VYNNFIVKPILKFSNNVTYKSIDRGLVELLGPQGLATTFSTLAKNISLLQSGIIYNYAFIIFIGATGLLIILNNINILPLDLILILFSFIIYTNLIKVKA